MKGYRILKIFNNNVILAKYQEQEVILVKKGIGYGKQVGDTIPSDIKFQKVFVLEKYSTRKSFTQLITRVDDEIIGICEEIISMIQSELEENLDEAIHIRLIDHIAFTLQRLMKKDEIINPFIIEIETLYRKEFEIAKKSVKILENRFNIHIPDDEVGFITLHIHAARNRGKVSNTLKQTYIINSITEVIEDELNIEIDRQSIDYARFVTHIRFAIKRIMNDIPIKNELKYSIEEIYTDSYKLALKIVKYLEEELKLKICEDEASYIALHVEKLKNTSVHFR